jgi:hypothetical protein
MINQNSLEQFIHDPETGTLSAKYLFLRGLQDLLTAVNAILLADVFQGPARPGITGRVVQKDAIASTSAEVLDLTIHLLQQIHFLTRYPLRLEDGTDLMGHTPWGLSRKPQPLQVVTARGMVMRMSSGRKIQCPIFWKICCTTKQAWTPLE